MNSAGNNSVTHIVISEEEQGQRIDNFLIRCCKGVPKSHLYRILRSGEVRVNSGRIDATYRLCLGDTLRIPPIRIAERPQNEVDEVAKQRVDLPNREVEAPFAQLLVQLRLRDVAVVVLVQNEGTQARTEMQSAQLRRAGRRDYPAVRGRPPFEQEAGVVRADPQILHREGAVAEKARPFRHVVDHHRAFFMNVEAGGLRRLASIAAFTTSSTAGLVVLVLVRLLVHPARLHHRPTLLTLEHGNFVSQLPNGFGLLQHSFLQFLSLIHI